MAGIIKRDDIVAVRERSRLDSFNATSRDLAAMKELTSDLIGRFLVDTVKATRAEFGEDNLGRYRADLVIPADTRAEIQLLKGIAVNYVMEPRENEPVYYQQRTLLADLVDALWNAGPDALEPRFAEAWRTAETEAGCLRALIDQVASLTDISANRWHARMCGMLSTQL